MHSQPLAVLQRDGFCPCCKQQARFIAHQVWLRDFYKCSNCGSIPRNRYLIKVVDHYFPHLAASKVYEAGPCGPSSDCLRRNAGQYLASQYSPDRPLGKVIDGVYNQDLEALTWPDHSFDLVVTQDVLEHVFHPDRALAEIIRVLKPGGYHIFTTPIWAAREKSVQRARIHQGVTEHLLEPVDHGGFLVTYDWGRDFVDLIRAACPNATTKVYNEADSSLGIEGEFLDVIVMQKQ